MSGLTFSRPYRRADGESRFEPREVVVRSMITPIPAITAPRKVNAKPARGRAVSPPKGNDIWKRRDNLSPGQDQGPYGSDPRPRPRRCHERAHNGR